MSPALPSGSHIAAEIRSKSISPVEIARIHLERIERLNPKLNAFVDCQSELVMQQARDAEKAVMRGDVLGPLHGVPLSIKASIDVAGHRCEAGTRLRTGRVAEKNAPLVARLRAAGAVILGVTNTPELLLAWETNNLLYGRTNNPWDLTRTARALHRHLRAETDARSYPFDGTFPEIGRPVCATGSCGTDGAHRG